MTIEFACAGCEKHYRVKDELAGKNAKCGQCGQRMQIPLPSAPDPPQEDFFAAADAQSNWSDQDFQNAAAAEPLAPIPARAVVCGGCGRPMDPAARVCLLCGYDKQIGGVRTKTTTKKKKLQWSLPSIGAGGLVRGTLLSMLAATLGAFIWAIVAYFSMREFGLLAWALGGLAGLGMAAGNESGDETFAGIIAAFVSLAGIVMAKVMIIVIVVMAILRGGDETVEMDPAAIERASLAADMTDDVLKKQGINPLNATGDQWKKASDAAQSEVARMSQAEVETKIRQLDERRAAEAQAQAAALKGKDGNDIAALEFPVNDDPGFVSLFFSLMFSPMDGLFMLFAFFTAYRIGSGQSTD